jgi:hypothetical protein
MSYMENHKGEIWDLSSGEIIPADDEPPQERDKLLNLAAEQVGHQLASLRSWSERRHDFSVMPGPFVLRQIAKDAFRLATELQARAETIDALDQPQQGKPDLPVSGHPRGVRPRRSAAAALVGHLMLDEHDPTRMRGRSQQMRAAPYRQPRHARSCRGWPPRTVVAHQPAHRRLVVIGVPVRIIHGRRDPFGDQALQLIGIHACQRASQGRLAGRGDPTGQRVGPGTQRDQHLRRRIPRPLRNRGHFGMPSTGRRGHRHAQPKPQLITQAALPRPVIDNPAQEPGQCATPGAHDTNTGHGRLARRGRGRQG